MNEAEIRMQAQLYALITEMHRLVATIEGMKAANYERSEAGYALAYSERNFAEVCDELDDVRARMLSNI